MFVMNKFLNKMQFYACYTILTNIIGFKHISHLQTENKDIYIFILKCHILTHSNISS